MVNFEFNAERKALILISEYGTRQEIVIGALFSPYQGSDGQEITVTVDRDNNIGASIKAGAIMTNKLANNIVDKLNNIVPAREIIDLIYPIGIILAFGEEFDPNVKWNFTEWKRIENCFTYASGNKNVGDIGGEEEHRLTVEELAEHYYEQDEHNHGVTADRKYGGNGAGDWGWIGWDNGDRGGRGNQTVNTDSKQSAIHSSGSGKPFSIMNPYQGVARWQRVE